MTGVDVLICAEDPGAANYLAPVQEGLKAGGTSSVFLAHTRITSTLSDRNVSFEVIDENTDAEFTIKMNSPKLLLVGTAEFPNCLGLQLIAAARRQNVKSLAVVDMGANVDRRFRGLGNNPLCYAPDWLGLCDHATAQKFEAIGFPSERIAIIGHPHFDVVRARRSSFEKEDRDYLRKELFPNADNRKVVVFVAEGVDRLDPSFSRRSNEYTLTGRGNNDFRTLIVLEELLDAVLRLDQKPYVVVRLHPKNDPSEFANFAGEIDLLSVGGDPLPLVSAADGVVGMTSMLLVESHLLGRPTFSIVPREEEASLIATTTNGMIPIATTREAVFSELSNMLNATRSNLTEQPLYDGSLSKLLEFVSILLCKPGTNRSFSEN